MILSFHPLISADKNMLCAGRTPDMNDLEAIRQADAVILPIGCQKILYDMVRKNCRHVFPDYAMRFDFPGKTGQIELFQKTGVHHPITACFTDLKDYDRKCNHSGKNQPMDVPFVFKFDWGGEGENVHLIRTMSDLDVLLEMARRFEKTGQKGFLLQELVTTDPKSLRIAVIGDRLFSYWRIQKCSNNFKSNLSSGAAIDFDSDPEMIEKAESDLRFFLKITGINLAGFDFLFSPLSEQPYFIEINYFFGRRGLGGSGKFYRILLKEINRWLERLGFSNRLELDID